MHSKHSIRKDFKFKRESLKVDESFQRELLLNSKKLLKKLLKTEGFMVGLYHPIKGELNIFPIINWLHRAKIICALPKIKSNGSKDMDFLLFEPSCSMKQNAFDVLEPHNSEIVIPDIIIVPLIACDLKGNRLGYGHGYYDRYIAKARETKKEIALIGMCHEGQISQVALPNEKHDQKLQFIVTDKRAIQV